MGDGGRQAADLAGGVVPRAGTGPRHASPRKSLLTRLQVPAGKAIAIAAMPTAVLMGMGLTSRIASADPLPKNPFSGTSCADTTEEPASAPPSSPASSSSSSGSRKGATPAPSASSSSASPSSAKSRQSTPRPTATSTPSASASAVTTTDPLDPLGVGDAINDLLDIRSSPTATASSGASPSATATPKAKAGSAKDTDTDSVTGRAKKTAEDTTATAKDAATKAGRAAKAANAAKSPATVTPRASASSTRTPYPCSTHDAKALAAADAAETSSLLPDTPWILKTDLLTLNGLDYQGVVEVKTHNGTVKKVLKFTAESVDIKNLHQIVDGPNGTTSHVRAGEGTTSTIRDGTVTMYTESLKGNLFGVFPVEFTPDSPPPVNVPGAFFTDVTVIQAGQFGGTLTVPGMHLYNET